MKEIKIIFSDGSHTLKRNLVPPTHQIDMFVTMIHYGYQSITIDGVDSSPEQVKRTIREEFDSMCKGAVE